jgi:hypothetical protein
LHLGTKARAGMSIIKGIEAKAILACHVPASFRAIVKALQAGGIEFAPDGEPRKKPMKPAMPATKARKVAVKKTAPRIVARGLWPENTLL